MSLAPLVLRNLQQKSLASSSSVFNSSQKQRWGPTAGSSVLRRWLSSVAGEETSAVKEVAVSDRDSNRKFKLFPRSSRKRGRSLWRSRGPLDLPPALSGLGNALVQATENIGKLLGKLSPSGLAGRVRKQDDCYKLQYYVPGLTKDDVKVLVEDGVLMIKGSRVEENQSDDEDDNWSGLSYFGFYDASIMLPDDAKVDEIKAEMKNGVLTIVIPRDERFKKDVKEIHVN